MYRPEDIDKIMNGRSVLEVALHVKMYVSGSLETDPESFKNDVKVLDWHLGRWIHFTYDSEISRIREFDDLVHKLIYTTWQMALDYQANHN